jgi:Rrf2 family protein
MKLSRASFYALRSMVFLARHDQGTLFPSHTIAQADGTPDRFLLKILKPLVSARMLRSVKGPHGGYKLARSPKDITLLDIIEAVDGPRRAEAPQFSNEASALDRKLQAACEDAAKAVRPLLQQVSLAQLAADTPKKKKRS